MSSAVPPLRYRQPPLIPMGGPLTDRLGADVFASIPEAPGVYRFYGEADRLLYIGQSVNLRARIGSYRYVTAGRHSRRIARMVARARRVEWEICESGAAAIALEARLLLEHAPPFNRAGVWQPPPRWLCLKLLPGLADFHLTREPDETFGVCIGPVPSAFRYTLGSLLRLLHRALHPHMPWWSLPHGLASPVVPPEYRLLWPEQDRVSFPALVDFVRSGAPEFLTVLTEGLSDLAPESPEGLFWLADAEALHRYAARRSAESRPD